MDYIYNMLEEPLECELNFQTELTVTDQYPDRFRRTRFNLSDVQYKQDYASLAILTNTDVKYWQMDQDDIISTINDIIGQYENLSIHCFTDYLLGKTNLNETILQYYRHVYDIADIIIAQSYIHDNSWIIRCIKELLITSANKNHISKRIIFYLSGYFIKMDSSNVAFKRTVKDKSIEFKNSYTVGQYFTPAEIDDYIQLTD